MSIKKLQALIGEHEFTQMSHVYSENSFGIINETDNLTELQFTIGLHDESSGWFEWYDIESGGEEWYCGGLLEFEDGALVGYDGCFALSTFITKWFKERGIDVSEVECDWWGFSTRNRHVAVLHIKNHHMINKNKFETLHEDFDILVIGRTLNFDYTRLSKERYKRMMRILRIHNKGCEFRYGASQDGYAYRCGCEHDCCGCISQSAYSIKFLKDVKRIKLVYFECYNYWVQLTRVEYPKPPCAVLHIMKLYEIYNRLEQIEDLFCQIEESALKRSDRTFVAQFTKEEEKVIVMLQDLLNDLLEAIPDGDAKKLDCVKYQLN